MDMFLRYCNNWHMPLILSIVEFHNNPISCGWLDGREYTRGKSGLLKAAVPGNARAG